jgi:hypothetical protein
MLQFLNVVQIPGNFLNIWALSLLGIKLTTLVEIESRRMKEIKR